MEKRIKRSLLLVVSLTLVVAYGFMIAMIYSYSLRNVETSLKDEMVYIKACIEAAGEEYLEYIDNVHTETRVTMIAPNGEVIYDSVQETLELENHGNREEIKEAFETGTGSGIRQSDTVAQMTIYQAVKLENGNVLRVAKPMNTAFYMAFTLLPLVIGIGVLMAMFAWWLTRHEVEKLIQPIDEIDLESPLESDVYEELHPLLVRIDKQNREKEQIAQMRREFTANVSHELKTPLTSISGYAEIMMNGMVRSEDIPGFSKRIYEEASRMIHLIGDIIHLSKLDEGHVEMEREDVNLYLLTREVVSRVSLLAEKRNVSIELTGESVHFHGIRAVLEEMIQNLCSNAIKYNKPGGDVTIWVGETLKEKKIVIRDTGIGIPEEHLERIFERFYRVDKSHSRERGGTGLGLSIVKHGALLHGADVKLESKVGEGTVVELIFPE